MEAFHDSQPIRIMITVSKGTYPFMHSNKSTEGSREIAGVLGLLHILIAGPRF